MFNRRNRNHHRYSQDIFPYLKKYLDRKAHRTAERINKRAAQLSRQKLKILVTVMASGWCLSCILIVQEGLQEKKLTYSSQRLSFPDMIRYRSVMDRSDSRAIQHIIQFQQFLDSLHLHDPTQYREIKRTRPGLIDSLHLAQDYLSTLK